MPQHERRRTLKRRRSAGSSGSRRRRPSMKAVVFSRKLWLDVVDVPQPAIEPDEVRVKVAYAGICGSDLHRSERATPEPGFIMGHEFCGTIDETGANVAGWKAGDRVVILPMVACGQCWGCRLGRP